MSRYVLAAVEGSFLVTDGSGAYKDLQGEGTYTGNAGLVFKVDYDPCQEKGDDACPVNRCAAFSDGLKLKKKDAEWQISNEGETPLTIDSLFIDWPAGNGNLTEVKLDGKKIYEQTVTAYMDRDHIEDWSGECKDRQIDAGKHKKLKFKFDSDGISQEPSDYTMLVRFTRVAVRCPSPRSRVYPVLACKNFVVEPDELP